MFCLDHIHVCSLVLLCYSFQDVTMEGNWVKRQGSLLLSPVTASELRQNKKLRILSPNDVQIILTVPQSADWKV